MKEPIAECSIFYLLMPLVLLMVLVIARPSSAEGLPEFGLMLNNDGDLSFTSMDPQESARALRTRVDSLAGTPVKTLMHSVGAGSDILYYPTRVASVWGWRKTRYDQHKSWGPRIARNKAGMAAGVDPIRVAGQRAKELGLFFVPSYRMNDGHFISNPFEYPLTGEFWLENYERFKIGQSPILANPNYANLLDFSHDEVRAYRLGVIFEVIERYQDIMDGIEMDFSRLPILFPPGKAGERGHLVTEMLEKVRHRLNEAGKTTGRRYHLFVRVPPAMKNCRWAGLEVEAWMSKRLVDVLIPSQAMTLAHDMPVDEFVALAKPAGCKVCPGLLPRTSWMWSFTRTPHAATYESLASRLPSNELILGAACNYWHMGASGFQLFNFGLPPFSQVSPILPHLTAPSSLGRTSKIYAITPAYYLDYEDSYEYKKSVPLEIEPGRTHALTLIIGENLAEETPAPDYCALRLGFRGAKPESETVVRMNGSVLHSGPMGEGLIAVSGGLPERQGWNPPPPASYLQLPIEDIRLLQQGNNNLEISVAPSQDQAEIALVEVQLGVMYEH